MTQPVGLFAVRIGRDDVSGRGQRLGVVDLQMVWFDPVAAVQQHFQIARTWSQSLVGSTRTWADSAGIVQVVDLRHAGPASHRRADQVRVQTLWGTLEEDPPGPGPAANAAAGPSGTAGRAVTGSSFATMSSPSWQNRPERG